MNPATPNNTSDVCPCRSGQSRDRCCGRFLAGAANPATAAELMRSRYSAYVLKDRQYLLSTWHPSTRPAVLELEDSPRWTGLEIKGTAGGPTDTAGQVEFVAHYMAGGRRGQLHETSRFTREGDRWYYVDGDIHASRDVAVGRNEPCPCGSGRKFKRCCAA